MNYLCGIIGAVSSATMAYIMCKKQGVYFGTGRRIEKAHAIVLLSAIFGGIFGGILSYLTSGSYISVENYTTGNAMTWTSVNGNDIVKKSGLFRFWPF